jgi:hypothetical protein
MPAGVSPNSNVGCSLIVMVNNCVDRSSFMVLLAVFRARRHSVTVGVGFGPLESVLADVMAVLKMDVRQGFGTIHLYRPDRSDLALASHRGAIDKIDLAKVESVVRGEGTISWGGPSATRHRDWRLEDVPV